MSFDPLEQNLDFEWLANNGWTPAGNLAYRHILHDYNEQGVLSCERIEQIIMQYDAEDQLPRIKAALAELIQLRNELWNNE